MERPVPEVIRQRYSCRAYRTTPLEPDVRRRLEDILAASGNGPLGTRCRFMLLAAAPGDTQALRGLGTYGFIKGATAFIVGVAGPGRRNLEDYGYLMEQAVLEATGLGLGTCWLGGTFSRSSFARRIRPSGGEVMPAVVAAGYPLVGVNDPIRAYAGSSRRLPAGELFWSERPGLPLAAETVGPYADILELVRWAPSASNKQPWRLIRTDRAWHFYLQRRKGYGKRSPLFALARLADLPRVDLGIAMCHFELATREAGLSGRWAVLDPEPSTPDGSLEYTVTWLCS